MNVCWKCGRTVPVGLSECEYGCVNPVPDEDTEKFARFLERFAKRRRLDWSRVQSIEDVICVLSTLFGDATVDPDSAEAKKLERFLEHKGEA